MRLFRYSTRVVNSDLNGFGMADRKNTQQLNAMADYITRFCCVARLDGERCWLGTRQFGVTDNGHNSTDLRRRGDGGT
eukprot:4977904-Alexandrium_andersonii.AAC.1